MKGAFNCGKMRALSESYGERMTSCVSHRETQLGGWQKK
jgi:hypothetical protein